MIDKYKKESRYSIQEILNRPFAQIPSSLEHEFHSYHKDQIFKFLLQVNILAQCAYVFYSIADWYILADIGLLAVWLKLSYTALISLVTILIYTFSQSLKLFDLMLPLSIIGAAAIWFYLLNLSHSPDTPIYLYASLIFVVLANLCVQIRFIPAVIISLIISAVIYTGVYCVVNADWHQIKLFSLIYTPVFMFSLYISWTSTQKSKMLFLHSKLDEINCQALNIIAHPDVLTGLHNRRQFTQLAEQEIQSAQKFAHPICLLMFDVDEFKKINDSYGYDIGDQVLQQIAETSSNILRANDVLARFGGEEFIMLLPRAHLEQTRQIAERLRKAIANSHLSTDDGTKLQYTISIGIAEFSVQNPDLNSVIKRADDALYQAKKNGRNQTRGYQPFKP